MKDARLPHLPSSFFRFSLLFSSLIALAACDSGPTSAGKLPKTFGVYVWEADAWQPVSESKPLAQLRPVFLVFDRRLENPMIPAQSVANLFRLRKVDRIVEEIFAPQGKAPIQYTTEETNILIREKDSLPMAIAPVGKRPDMLTFTPQADLESGNYALVAMDKPFPFLLENAIPSPAPLHKWYKTVHEGGGFTYDGFFAMSQKGWEEEKSYNNRPILAITMHSQGDFSSLLEHLKLEGAEVMREPHLERQTTFLKKIQFIDPATHAAISKDVKKWIDAELNARAARGDSAFVVGLATAAQDQNVLSPDGQRTLNIAKSEIKKFEDAEQEKMAWLSNDSEADGTEIARFETSSDNIFRSKTPPYAAVTNRYAYKTPDHPMSQTVTRWLGYLAEIKTSEERSPWNGKTLFIVTTRYTDPSGTGNLQETLTFKDSALQQKYVQTLAAARNTWSDETKKYRLTDVVAPPLFWSPRVYVKGCDLFTFSPSGGFDVCSDRSELVPITPDRQYLMEGASWLRFRSKSDHSLTVSVERFPFPQK